MARRTPRCRIWFCLFACGAAVVAAAANAQTPGGGAGPEVPVLVAPTEGAVVDLPVSLEVMVTSSDGAALDVSFYGRERGTVLEPFTVVVLPDTQHYVSYQPNAAACLPEGIFRIQTEWIVASVEPLNIVFVSHEGDLVDTSYSAAEWALADEAMSLLDGVVPYGVLPGNKDQPTTLYNSTYFPFTRFDGESWYGGHYPATKNDSSYQLISPSGQDLLFLHLEHCPAGDTLAWARQVLAAHPGRKAIITTHDYFTSGGNTEPCDNHTSGLEHHTDAIWDDLIVTSTNSYFLLVGHNSGEHTETASAGGHDVHLLLADYQNLELPGTETECGNGWLRLMTFEPAEDQVHVQTYSPYLDAFDTDARSDFHLSFPMAEFALIGRDKGVASGATGVLAWSGREAGRTYEWYAVASDALGRSATGPVWTFAVAVRDAGPAPDRVRDSAEEVGVPVDTSPVADVRLEDSSRVDMGSVIDASSEGVVAVDTRAVADAPVADAPVEDRVVAVDTMVVGESGAGDTSGVDEGEGCTCRTAGRHGERTGWVLMVAIWLAARASERGVRRSLRG